MDGDGDGQVDGEGEARPYEGRHEGEDGGDACVYDQQKEEGGGTCWHAQGHEQALVSLKLKKSVDAEGGRTFAVVIEGG